MNVAGRRHVRDLVKQYRPSIIILMETHCLFQKAGKFWKSLGYDGCAISEAQGQAGGIWILLEHGSEFTVSVKDIFHQAVTVFVSRGNKLWHCSTIYASPIPVVRDILWKHLQNIRASITGPWLLMGDFNEILVPSEVRGGNFSLSRATKFSNSMEDCNLLDLGAVGNAFTWFRRAIGSQPISKRLDRALADIDMRRGFPEAYVENLCRRHSDHCPLLLRCNAIVPDKKLRPFRFQAA